MYLHVSIRNKNGWKTKCKTHRLILIAFIGGPPTPSHQCCHTDGNPRNNNIKNLRWGTPKENIADRNLHGRTPRGEQHARSKLSEKDVKEIRQLYTEGNHSQPKLAKIFNVYKTNISAIILRKTWKHI